MTALSRFEAYEGLYTLVDNSGARAEILRQIALADEWPIAQLVGPEGRFRGFEFADGWLLVAPRFFMAWDASPKPTWLSPDAEPDFRSVPM